MLAYKDIIVLVIIILTFVKNLLMALLVLSIHKDQEILLWSSSYRYRNRGSERLGTMPKCRAVISYSKAHVKLSFFCCCRMIRLKKILAENWISFNQRLISISSVAVNIWSHHRPIHMYSKYLHGFQTVCNFMFTKIFSVEIFYILQI